MNDFSKVMLEIKEHYNNSTAPYKFKTPLRASNDPLPDEAIVAQNNFHSQNTNFSNYQEDSITKNSQKYIDDKDYEDFKSRMEKNRKEAKERADALMDEYADKMIAAGEKHPESQESIISTVEKTLQFFNNEVMKKISDFEYRVVDNIVKWGKDVFKKIKEVFLNIEKAIANFY